jgi:hypothetical protein
MHNSSTTHRPIQIPIGPLVKFITTLLSCTTDDKVRLLFLLLHFLADKFQYTGHYDATIRAMEVSVIPNIWKLSCDLILCLAKRSYI